VYINTSHPDFIGGSRAVARLMEKIGKDNEARKSAQPGTAETLGAATRSHDGGATPLSSSSLSNYYNTNGEDGDSVRTGTLPPNSYDMSGGGIKNFFFRGGKHPKASSLLEQDRLQNRPPSIVHLPQVPDTMRQADVPPTERECVEMEIMKSLIESYLALRGRTLSTWSPRQSCTFW